MIEKKADVTYFGNQPTNPFALIHKRKIKPLINLLKQYYSTKKYKELDSKFKNLKDELIDYQKSNLPQKLTNFEQTKENVISSKVDFNIDLPKTLKSINKFGASDKLGMTEEMIDSDNFLLTISSTAERIHALKNVKLIENKRTRN